jgi:hypothetical protein
MAGVSVGRRGHGRSPAVAGWRGGRSVIQASHTAALRGSDYVLLSPYTSGQFTTIDVFRSLSRPAARARLIWA